MGFADKASHIPVVERGNVFKGEAAQRFAEVYSGPRKLDRWIR